MEKGTVSQKFAYISGETRTDFYDRPAPGGHVIVVSFSYFKFYEVDIITEKYVYLRLTPGADRSFAFLKEKVTFVLESLPESMCSSVIMEVQHIFDSGANELRVLSMVESLLKGPLDMLAEIDAWLSMNTEPNREQTAALRADIQKLLRSGK